MGSEWAGGRPEAWMDLALCREVGDPDLWFPERGGVTAPAKKVCARCPSRRPCLDHALANNEHWGVWGGASERERRHLRRAWLADADDPDVLDDDLGDAA